MATSLSAIVVDCRDSLSQASWWATVLGHQLSERNPNEYEVSHPSSGGTRLYFMNVPEAKPVKNRLHVDITTDGSVEAEVARLVAAGGTFVEMRQDLATLQNPDTWAVMQDPEGNEFCVLNADSITGLM
ncbi:MAG: VOC family protein [Propionibacteriales bacterium]|nr:VOC family protein [Propionibacteriales bacterium]